MAATTGGEQFFLKNLQRSINLFKENEKLYMHYNDDRTGYFMVIANEDSCYGPMPFFFKFELGPQYPFQPPTCKFISTDSNRIHPNLYVNGKVCLSILGTWSGPGWMASMTLFHLAETLQQIVNEAFPLQCEPGYEGSRSSTVKEYNVFLESIALQKLAVAGYDIPIDDKKAQTYFEKCLEEFLSNEETFNQIKGAYSKKLKRIKRSPPRSSRIMYGCRLLRKVTDTDLERLFSKLDDMTVSVGAEYANFSLTKKVDEDGQRHSDEDNESTSSNPSSHNKLKSKIDPLPSQHDSSEAPVAAHPTKVTSTSLQKKTSIPSKRGELIPGMGTQTMLSLAAVILLLILANVLPAFLV